MLLSATPPPGPRPAQEARVREEAARHRGLTPPRTHPLASITWLGPAASNPALAYRIGGDPADLAESVRWIEAASRLPHWGRAHMPDHDLDAGFGCSTTWRSPCAGSGTTCRTTWPRCSGTSC